MFNITILSEDFEYIHQFDAQSIPKYEIKHRGNEYTIDRRLTSMDNENKIVLIVNLKQ
jgi:hypothetical protein